MKNNKTRLEAGFYCFATSGGGKHLSTEQLNCKLYVFSGQVKMPGNQAKYALFFSGVY
ncbi:MAG: hypothetical protein ACI8WB_004833 [Phenylobacterium sp.]|jgi:hypothetical protein